MKKPSSRASGFLEDFSDWMGSREGLESMDAMDAVYNALDGARVDPSDRKILWPDDQGLSIEQSAERIRKDSGLDAHLILTHIIGWLQMGYVPEALDEEQMERFENQIDAWVEEYENGHPPALDF